MRKALLPALAILVAATWGQDGPAGAVPPPSAGSSPYMVTTSIDWRRRVLSIDVSLDFKKAGLSLPEGRLTAERMVARDLPGLAKDAFFSIPVDSEGTIGDSVLDGRLSIDSILRLTAGLRHVGDSFSQDILSFRSRWELPLGSAAALFVDWGKARSLPEPLGWTATKDYTGIVIYADGMLPVKGERGVYDNLRPGLFARILDEETNIVMDRWVVDPAALVDEGPLGYVTARSSGDEARVGDDPLLVRAAGLFGVNRTDIVIDDADAARILDSAANRALIAEGRIIVVIKPDKSTAAGG